MLSDLVAEQADAPDSKCLNAPYGARCFLTKSPTASPHPCSTGLNAPFGARRFLTAGLAHVKEALENGS